MIRILIQHIETQYKIITIIFNYNNSNHHFNDLKINNAWHFCQTFSLINGVRFNCKLFLTSLFKQTYETLVLTF